MRVAVIPTGDMEWRALQGPQGALGRLFPGHDFYCLPSQAEIASNADLAFPIPSFTSCDVTTLFGRENNADGLIARAAAEALGDRRRDAADLVVILDDLELKNCAQPEAVVRVVKEAAQRHLSKLEQRTADRTRRVLRERVSFHIVVPMIESWLFADPRGATNAGAPPLRRPRFRHDDPEGFETDDSEYAAATEEECTCWRSLPDRRESQRKRRKKLRPAWAGQHDRTRHPKGYLQWLCFDPASKSCTTYDETKGGAGALARLDWASLLGSPQMPFLRSLVADIADALDQDPSVGPIDEPQPPPTSRRRSPADAILRNL
jgi:hypothetical protein